MILTVVFFLAKLLISEDFVTRVISFTSTLSQSLSSMIYSNTCSNFPHSEEPVGPGTGAGSYVQGKCTCLNLNDEDGD